MKNNSTLIYSNDGIIIYADNLSLEQKDVLLSQDELNIQFDFNPQNGL